MPIDDKFLLYCLAKTFNTTLGIEICDDTTAYLKAKSKKFSKLSTDEKMYYTKYSIQLAQSLSEYFTKIKLFELNTDPDHIIIHDFRLIWEKNNIAHVSMSHNSINVKDLIPEKLMKICKYRKNSNVYKEYTEQYQKINNKGYQKIQSKTKYSELSDKTKNSAILEPMCDLVMNTISRKRKCAQYLYNHLFNESDRIVLRLYKKRFTIYDFGAVSNDIDSFKTKLYEGNEIEIIFSNKAKFTMCLHTNAPEIKEHLSIKFRTQFKNMDEIYAVCTTSI